MTREREGKIPRPFKRNSIYDSFEKQCLKRQKNPEASFNREFKEYTAYVDFFQLLKYYKIVGEALSVGDTINIDIEEIFLKQSNLSNSNDCQFLSNAFEDNDDPESGYEGQTRHEHIQGLFDNQREKTSEVHGSLETLLKEKDLTNPNTQLDLDEISGRISYDINLFYEVAKEVKLFREGINKKFPSVHYVEAFVFYNFILELKPTSTDFVRALTMQYVIDSIKDSQEKYHSIKEDQVKEAYANIFLKNINLSGIIKDAISNINRKLLINLIDENLHSFEDAYERYSNKIGIATGISKKKKEFDKRYELGQDSPNKELLLDAVGDEEEFNNRKRFSNKYGEVEEPLKSYEFINKYFYSSKNNATKKALTKYLNNDRLSHFVKMESEGTLAQFIHLVQLNDNRKDLIIEAMTRGDADLTIEVLDIVAHTKIYESIYQSMDDMVRSQIKSPSEIIAEKDFDAMKTYYDDLDRIEKQVKRENPYKHLKTNRFKILDRMIDWIAESDYEFLKIYSEQIIEAKDLFVNNGHPVGYGAMLHQITRATTTGDRCSILYNSIREYKKELEACK